MSKLAQLRSLQVNGVFLDFRGSRASLTRAQVWEPRALWCPCPRGTRRAGCRQSTECHQRIQQFGVLWPEDACFSHTKAPSMVFMSQALEPRCLDSNPDSTFASYRALGHLTRLLCFRGCGIHGVNDSLPRGL